MHSVTYFKPRNSPFWTRPVPRLRFSCYIVQVMLQHDHLPSTKDPYKSELSGSSSISVAFAHFVSSAWGAIRPLGSGTVPERHLPSRQPPARRTPQSPGVMARLPHAFLKGEQVTHDKSLPWDSSSRSCLPGLLARLPR